MTLNQLVARIKAICEAHEQINTFVFGDIDDKLRQDVIYPAAFLPYPLTQIQGPDTLDSFSLFIMDRVIVGGSSTDNTYNELEVTSDCRSIAKDLQAQFLYQKFNPTWNVQKNFSITPLNETDPDYLAGVQLQFTIKSPYTANRCQVPTTYNYGS